MVDMMEAALVGHGPMQGPGWTKMWVKADNVGVDSSGMGVMVT